MTYTLKGRVALVTGSGRGIGAAIARRLASAGATVHVADLDAERCQSVVDDIRRDGGDAHALVLDVSSEDSWEEAVSAVEEKSKYLDTLVNNVGVTIAKSVEDTTLADWRLMMAVNLEAPFVGVKTALPLMKRSAERTPFGGSIINMSSISGIVGTPNLSCYAATKAGLRYFSKSAALEFARAGYRIRVNTVHPGLIEGASANVLFESSVNSGACKDMAEAEALWTSRLPVGHMGRQQDIGGGVLFLASDDSSFMTGTELIIDGGLTAQ